MIVECFIRLTTGKVKNQMTILNRTEVLQIMRPMGFITNFAYHAMLEFVHGEIIDNNYEQKNRQSRPLLFTFVLFTIQLQIQFQIHIMHKLKKV